MDIMEHPTPGRIIDYSATCPYVPLYLCFLYTFISIFNSGETNEIYDSELWMNKLMSK